MPENTMPIALLSQAGESGRHLRDALAASGTPIVYESQAAEFDREALEQSGARVVVVNLDPEVEAHLDDVYSLLEDDRYNVIFNDAQVSSQLSGWEQARWARHLAAKILGSENADPPRPEGAEPVPQRAIPAAVALSIEADEAENAAVETARPDLVESGAVEVMNIELDSVVEVDEFADIVALLSESEADPLNGADDEIELASAPMAAADDAIPMSALDLSGLEDFTDSAESSVASGVEADDEFEGISLMDDEPDAFAGDATVEMQAFAAPDSSVDDVLGFGDLDGFADIDAESFETVELVSVDEAESEPIGLDLAEIAVAGDVASRADDALGFGDLDGFADADEALFESIEMESVVDISEDNLVESGLIDAALAGDAAASGNELEGLELLDLDLSEDPPITPSDTPDTESALEGIKVPEVEPAFGWGLEDLDDPALAPSADTDKEASAAPFGIEKISASEYLAPTDEVVEDKAFDGGLSLELIPLEEAVAPQASNTGALASESWLDPSSQVAISRVWVLGASIGGPEAVREFLADIPAKAPALFLLAQHMGAEFMDIMAQQLVRSTSLTVRTPSHGERVNHGDILIVPTTHRLRVDRAGVVTLEAQAAGTRPNSPSIDQVLEDVADRFGSKAGAIIFSGMAEDAAEGSRYLVGIGGTVYAQDPETCVISSMVDGVIETGVVSFVGSPKALAGKLLGELNVAVKS